MTESTLTIFLFRQNMDVELEYNPPPAHSPPPMFDETNEDDLEEPMEISNDQEILSSASAAVAAEEFSNFATEFDLLTPAVVESNSTFLRRIRSFSQHLQDNAFAKFDKIIELRWQKLLPESTYALIVTEILNIAQIGIEHKFTEEEWAMNEQVRAFAASLHLQREYLVSLGNYFAPQQIEISEELSIQYISIIELATFVLTNKSIFARIQWEKSDNFVYNFTKFSSELTCEYDRWKHIKGKLRILLYLDEYSIGNPIGPARAELKYLGVYCAFTNVPLKDRLKRDDSFLLLKTKHKKISPAMLNSVLGPLNQDLEQLYRNGINVPLENGQIVNVEVVVSSHIGDNLAVYGLTGYPTTFYLGYCCRMCAANWDQIQQGITKKRLLGTPSDIAQYQRLHQEAAMANIDSLTASRLGVVRPFVFADLPLTNPWSSFPPDPFHDIILGVLENLTSLILRTLTKECLTSYVRVAEIISNYQFYDSKFSVSYDRNKKKFKLNGDGIQVSVE